VLTVRRAFTLVELIVALVVGGVAFGAFSAVMVNGERSHARLRHRIHARAQALAGLATLAQDLRALSPSAGDIIAAEDSAIELRATVATLSVCELRDSAAITAHASFVSPPKIGDTLWTLVVDDSTRWLPLSASGADPIAAGDSALCRLPAKAAGTPPRTSSSRQRYRLTFAQPPPVVIGPSTALRLTRHVRYSLYRAPDGQWYLGRREWSAPLGRFETIQPLSGPYRPYAASGTGLSGLELRYRDRAGQELSPPGTTDIAAIELTIRTRPPPSDGSIRRRDETSIVVAPRNQR
jgi:prepilin-type N-terminal cleavage/methylation domain-containing protein